MKINSGKDTSRTNPEIYQIFKIYKKCMGYGLNWSWGQFEHGRDPYADKYLKLLSRQSSVNIPNIQKIQKV